MIIANDEGWAICTPAETGREAVAHHTVGRHAHAAIPRHMSHLGRAGEGSNLTIGKRVLIVRHPIDRVIATYMSVKTSRTRWCAGVKDFDTFLDALAAARRRDVEAGIDRPWKNGGIYERDRRAYTMSLSEYAGMWDPHRVFRLEDGLDGMYEYLGIEPLPTRRSAIPRSSLVTPDLRASMLAGLQDARYRWLMRDFVGQDIERWYEDE